MTRGTALDKVLGKLNSKDHEFILTNYDKRGNTLYVRNSIRNTDKIKVLVKGNNYPKKTFFKIIHAYLEMEEPKTKLALYFCENSIHKTKIKENIKYYGLSDVCSYVGNDKSISEAEKLFDHIMVMPVYENEFITAFSGSSPNEPEIINNDIPDILDYFLKISDGFSEKAKEI